MVLFLFAFSLTSQCDLLTRFPRCLSHFLGASLILQPINKVNLFLQFSFLFFFLNPQATQFRVSTLLQYISPTDQRKSSLHLSDPHSQLITRVLLSGIFPSSSAAVVTNGTQSIWPGADEGGNEIMAIKSDPYAGVP